VTSSFQPLHYFLKTLGKKEICPTMVFAVTRAWVGPMSGLSLELADMSMSYEQIKFRILQFCLLPLITVYLSSRSAPELGHSQMGAGSMPVLSM